jgi:hypothetical protein
VRRIFAEMLTSGSPTQIAANLTMEGITTKAWTTQEGQTRSGKRIDKKYLHKLLRNRIFLGEISHKGKWFPGVHAAIIDQALWGLLITERGNGGNRAGNRAAQGVTRATSLQFSLGKRAKKIPTDKGWDFEYWWQFEI